MIINIDVQMKNDFHSIRLAVGRNVAQARARVCVCVFCYKCSVGIFQKKLRFHFAKSSKHYASERDRGSSEKDRQSGKGAEGGKWGERG